MKKKTVLRPFFWTQKMRFYEQKLFNYAEQATDFQTQLGSGNLTMSECACVCTTHQETDQFVYKHHHNPDNQISQPPLH